MTELAAGRIRHTVVFTPKAAPNSDSEAELLTALAKLKTVPGVERFEMLEQVSPKSGHRYGLSMEFAGPEAYEAYNVHPDHVAFVQNHWIPGVADFQELDFTGLEDR
jgi:stress responsive alpha/beta barrel protein